MEHNQDLEDEAVIDLSITVASYNTLEYTKECIKSIYENTRRINFEIIIVDNNSTDGSPDMIRKEFPGVTLICNDKNLGIPKATNLGISISKGRYFITINSDVVIVPGSLERLVEFMDTHPDAGAATARLILPDGGEHPPVCGNAPSLRSELLEAYSPFSSNIAKKAANARFSNQIDYSKTQDVPCITWGTAFIVRREVLESVGGQDPLFFVYSEDSDWSMRIKNAGWKLYYVADAPIIHYGGRSTGQTKADSLARLWKSKCQLIQKHYGLIAGLVLRSSMAFVCSIRAAKWLLLYPLSSRQREEASVRIKGMWRIIRAVLSY
ncbi:MAG: glycosyltransferase family 2 protein [Armatimonadota bacterium]